MKYIFSTIAGLLCFAGAMAKAQQITDLQGMIDDQLNAGSSTVTIAPGRYYVAPSSSKHLLLENLNDKTLIMDGVEMICTETTQAINIKNCTNLKLQGLTIDYDPLCFTQGRITSISGGGLVHDVELIEGYPESGTTDGDKYEVYDPVTGTLRCRTYYGATYTLEGPTNLVVTVRSDKGAQVGDIIVLGNDDAPGGYNPHGIRMEDSTGLVLEDITLYGSPTFGFLETDCSDSHYLNCTIDRRPPETDFKTREVQRMRSLNADAYHSKHADIGPFYENCVAKFNGDDSVAINGHYHMVTACNGQTLRVLAKLNDMNIQVGDPVELWEYTGLRLDDAIVQQVVEVGSATSAELSFLSNQSMRNVYKDGSQLNKAYEITIDRSVDMPMGSLIGSANRMGNGFKVIGGTFGFNRSRGILVKASNGLVQSNVVEGCWGDAIKSQPEFWWLEAGCSWNLTISDNTITNCLGSGIAVYAKSGDGAISPAGAHGNIVLMNNTITDTVGRHIRITSTKGLLLENNTYDTILTENCDNVWGVPVTFQASSDFSSVQGENNWYYQEYDGSTYTDMTWDSSNSSWKGAGTYPWINSSATHPYSGLDAVRVWEASEAGEISISGAVSKDSGGNGVIASIYKNASLLWSDTVDPDTALTPSGVSDIAVSAGDRIYFHINDNGSSTSDYTSWNPIVKFLAPDTSPPAAPTDLVATAGDDSVLLDWFDNMEFDLMHYDVYRSTTAGSGYISICSGLTTSKYVDPSVTNGTTYYYVVTALDTDSKESEYSNEASATPEEAPVELTIVGHTAGAEQSVNQAFESYDNNESTRWANDSSLTNAWIQYDLGSAQDISQVKLMMYSGNTRTYPIRIEVGSVEVFNGHTEMTNGYWEAVFEAVSGRYITITMTGSNSDGSDWFSIYETEVYGQQANVVYEQPVIDMEILPHVLRLSWPANAAPALQVQSKTNLTDPVWMDVDVTSTSNAVEIPIDPAVGSLFYRLVSP